MLDLTTPCMAHNNSCWHSPCACWPCSKALAHRLEKAAVRGEARPPETPASTYAHNKAKEDITSAKTASDLLTGLKFGKVKIHVCLSKSQIVEKMDMLQCEIETFKEDNAQTKPLLVISTISISPFWNFDERPERDQTNYNWCMKKLKPNPMEKSRKDGS